MRVSIVTSCLNAQSTIADTINSVRSQEYADYEHIIVDGASKDGTLSVVKSLQHDRMKVVSAPDDGLYDAMNKGFALATGDLVGFLNADDFFSRRDALSLIVGAARSNGDADAVSCGVAIVDPVCLRRVRRVYRADGFRRGMLRFGHMPPHPGFYVRTSSFAKVGKFSTTYRISGDFEWMVRFFLVHRMKVVTLPDTVVTMRAGGVSSSGWQSTLDINNGVRRALRTHGIWTTVPLIWSKYILKAGQMFFPRPSIPDSVRWEPE